MKNAMIASTSIILLFSACNFIQDRDSGENFPPEMESIDTAVQATYENFDNRKIHKKLTTGILSKTSDENLLQTVWDNMQSRLPEDSVQALEIVEKWNEPQQNFYKVWMYENNVNNGGHAAFFAGPGSLYYEQIPGILEKIGATDFSALSKKANTIYEAKARAILTYQSDTSGLKSYNDNPLTKTDDDFYALYNNDDLRKYLIKYVRENEKDFTQ